MTQEVLKLSQEALTGLKDVEKQVRELVAENRALKEALAQTQEPVAWATKEDFHRELERRLKHIREEIKIKSVTMRCKDYDIALPIIDTDYFGRVLVGQVSTPPQRTEQEPLIGCVNHDCDKCKAQRTWVGLTDEEMYRYCPNWLSQSDFKAMMLHVEAKLKQKNGYAEENT